MATEFATLGLNMDSTPAARAGEELQRLTARAREVTSAVATMGGSVASDLNRVNAQARELRGGFGAMQLDVQRFSDAVGGAVVPIGHALPEAALKGEYGLGRLERSMATLGIEAAGLSGEGGHIAHIGATLASLGIGGPVVLGFIAAFAAMTLLLKAFGEEAEQERQRIRDLEGEADKLGRTDFSAVTEQLESAKTAVLGAEKALADLQAHGPDLSVSASRGGTTGIQGWAEYNQKVHDATEEIKKADRAQAEFQAKQDAMVASQRNELEKLNALNAAYRDGATARALIEIHYQALLGHSQNAVIGNEKERKAADDLTDALARAKVQRVLNEAAIQAEKDAINLKNEATQRELALQRSNPISGVPLMFPGQQLPGGVIAGTPTEAQLFPTRGTSLEGMKKSLNEELERYRKHAQTLAEIAADNAARAAQQIEHSFAHLFDEILTKGLGSFDTLMTEMERGFAQLVSKILAQNYGAQIGKTLGVTAGPNGIAVAPTPAGLAVGGFVAGFEIMKGLLGWMDSAAQKAAAIAKATRDLGTALNSYDSAIQAGTLADKIQKERERTAALEAQALAVERQTADVQTYYAELERIHTGEAQHIRDLEDEAAQQQAVALANLAVRTLRAQGMTEEADALAFQLQQQAEYVTALKAAADAQAAYKWAVENGGTADQLATLALQESTAQTYLQTLAEVQKQEALKRSIDLQKQALQAQIDADQKRVDSAQQMLDATTRTVGTLQSYYHELQRLTASPIQDIGLAKQSLQDLAAKALAGDQTAAGQLPEVARQFLELSRQYNASGAGYTADVQYVKDLIGPIIDFYQQQETDQQKMIDLVQQQVALEKQQLDVLNDLYSGPPNTNNPDPHFGHPSASAAASGVRTEVVLTDDQFNQLIEALTGIVNVGAAGASTIAKAVNDGTAQEKANTADLKLAVESMRI